MFLLELVGADTMLGFSAAFLQQLAGKARQLGMVVVVDEVMTAMRCGQSFAFNYLPAGMFRPDYVVVGKGLLFGAVLGINLDEEAAELASKVNGLVTCPVGVPLLRQACRILEVLEDRKLLSNVRLLGRAIFDQLQPAVDRYNGGSKRSRRGRSAAAAPSGGAAVLRGVGAMWYTNLAFKGDVRRVVFFNRLLPYLSLHPSKVQQQLVPAGWLCKS